MNVQMPNSLSPSSTANARFFEFTILTPHTFLPPDHPESMEDDLAEQFAHFLCTRVSQALDARVNRPQNTGEAFLNMQFDSFEERFLRHSKFAIFITSGDKAQCLDFIYARMLVFLTIRPTWRNRAFVVYIGEPRGQEIFDQNIFAIEPLIFSLNTDEWETNQGPWKRLLGTLRTEVPLTPETRRPKQQTSDASALPKSSRHTAAFRKPKSPKTTPPLSESDQHRTQTFEEIEIGEAPLHSTLPCTSTQKHGIRSMHTYRLQVNMNSNSFGDRTSGYSTLSPPLSRQSNRRTAKPRHDSGNYSSMTHNESLSSSVLSERSQVSPTEYISSASSPSALNYWPPNPKTTNAQIVYVKTQIPVSRSHTQSFSSLDEYHIPNFNGHVAFADDAGVQNEIISSDSGRLNVKTGPFMGPGLPPIELTRHETALQNADPDCTPTNSLLETDPLQNNNILEGIQSRIMNPDSKGSSDSLDQPTLYGVSDFDELDILPTKEERQSRLNGANDVDNVDFNDHLPLLETDIDEYCPHRISRDPLEAEIQPSITSVIAEELSEQIPSNGHQFKTIEVLRDQPKNTPIIELEDEIKAQKYMQHLLNTVPPENFTSIQEAALSYEMSSPLLIGRSEIVQTSFTPGNKNILVSKSSLSFERLTAFPPDLPNFLTAILNLSTAYIPRFLSIIYNYSEAKITKTLQKLHHPDTRIRRFMEAAGDKIVEHPAGVPILLVGTGLVSPLVLRQFPLAVMASCISLTDSLHASAQQPGAFFSDRFAGLVGVVDATPSFATFSLSENRGAYSRRVQPS